MKASTLFKFTIQITIISVDNRELKKLQRVRREQLIDSHTAKPN